MAKAVGKSPAKGIGGWEIESATRNVLVVKCATKTNVICRPSPFLLIGDCHWDNPDCDREQLAADLDRAIERDAPILIGGDFFCAMQGQWDRRANKEKLRDEHRTGCYLDSLVETAAEWLTPWKDNILLLCCGNHETAILKHHETNLTARLAAALRKLGSPVVSGGYAGWIRIRVLNNQFKQSFILHYHHGFGGGGPVTKGKIDFNRYRDQAEFDAMWSQHVHHTEIFDTRVAYLNRSHEVAHKTVWNLRTPSYKDEYKDGFGGWHVERGQGPRPKGGIWLEVYPKRNGRKSHRRYELHAERTRE